MNNSVYQKIKALQRFRYLKLSVAFFLVSVMLIVLAVTIQSLDPVFPLFMITAFVLFFVEMGLLIAFAISSTKKEPMVRGIIIDDYWNTHIETWTYSHEDSFSITQDRKQDHRFLTHHIIPNYASEQFYYTLTNKDRHLDVHAIRYSHQVSTGKGTSQVIDFSGYMIKTPIPAGSDLYIRKWDLSEKIRSTFNIVKPDRIEDEVGINGSYDQHLKSLRQSLLTLGFKDVIFIEQEGFMTVLCEDFKLIPKVTKKDEENEERHKTHLLRLCKVTSLIASVAI